MIGVLFVSFGLRLWAGSGYDQPPTTAPGTTSVVRLMTVAWTVGLANAVSIVVVGTLIVVAGAIEAVTLTGGGRRSRLESVPGGPARRGQDASRAGTAPELAAHPPLLMRAVGQRGETQPRSDRCGVVGSPDRCAPFEGLVERAAFEQRVVVTPQQENGCG